MSAPETIRESDLGDSREYYIGLREARIADEKELKKNILLYPLL